MGDEESREVSEEIERHLELCREFYREHPSGFIGEVKKTPEAWERVRQDTERWMNEMSKHGDSVSFTHKGEEVTPEMIADWYFDPLTESRLIDVTVAPKSPIGRIKVTLILNEEDEDG